MTKPQEEGLRLAATWLNTMAAGFVVTGFAVPLIAFGYHAGGYQMDWNGAGATIFTVACGAFFHAIAQTLLYQVTR